MNRCHSQPLLGGTVADIPAQLFIQFKGVAFTVLAIITYVILKSDRYGDGRTW
jgi:hypothetical protein